MHKNKNLLFFIFALTLLSAALYFYRSGDTFPGDGHGVFALSADDEVSKMILSDNKGNQVMLQKQASDVWLLNDSMEADKSFVREALLVLHRMEMKGPVAFENRTQAKKLLQEKGVLLDVYKESYLIKLPGGIRLFPGNRKISSMWLGSDTINKRNHLFMHHGDNIPYRIDLPVGIRCLHETFPANAYLWQSRLLMHYKLDEIRKIEVRYPDVPSESFRLLLDNEAFEMTDGKGLPVDTSRVSMQRIGRFLNGFRYLFYEKAVPVKAGETPGDQFSDTPFLAIFVEDHARKQTELFFFRRQIPEDGTLASEKRPFDPNRFYIHGNDDLYLLSLYLIFQPVMRPLSYFYIIPENN